MNQEYLERVDPVPFDDTPFTDEYQDEVYRHALAIALKHGLTSVLDIGCGGAYKLLKYFLGLNTTGVEIEPTLSWLRSTYPARTWVPPGEAHGQYDLVICSDVIEHVQDPDALLENIKAVRPKWIVISTPDRMLVPGADPFGPPRNKAHIREWSKEEFSQYLSGHFDVVQHFISHQEHATQLAVCRG